MNKIYIGLLIVTLLLGGCRSDFDDLELESWKPIAALPLVSSEITVNDVLTELNHPEEVLILENGVVALNYKGELVSFSPNDLLALPAQSESETFQLGGAEALAIDNSGGVEVDFPVNVAIPLTIDPSDVRIDEVLLNTGNLSISFTRLQDENLTGELEIAELKDENGNALAVSFSGNGLVGVAETVSVDLAGYTLEPTFIPPSTHRVNLGGILTVSDNSMNTAAAGDFVDFSLELTDLVFEHVLGDFGNLSLGADGDSISVDLFQNIQSGQFTLNEAIINLNVTNSFGIPTLVELGQVVSVNQNTGEVTPLLLENINLSGQTDLGGVPEMETFTFDNSNSQVTSLFEPAPKLVLFNISTESNPDGSPPPSSPNFIMSESAIDIDIDLILPLEGYAENLVVTNTIPADIGFEEYAGIDSLEFKLFTNNSFPLDISLQAYFLDELGIEVDSLFLDDTSIISSAEVNANGDVVSSSEQVSFIKLNEERSLNLENVTDVRFRARFNTSDSENEKDVRIKEDQTVDIKLGVKIFGNIEE
ncbi:MAG: hypothetical protein AB8B53_12500 [Flavobacteriales bacterium]